MTRTLKSEIKQNKDFASVEEEAVLNVQRTADLFSRRFAEVLKPFGLSGTQYNVLRILRGAGAEGLPCKDVSDRLITHDPDVTRLLDRLESRGLVQRGREHPDRRVILAFITDEGLRVLADLDRAVTDLHPRLLGHLSREDLETLNRLLVSARQTAD